MRNTVGLCEGNCVNGDGVGKEIEGFTCEADSVENSDRELKYQEIVVGRKWVELRKYERLNVAKGLIKEKDNHSTPKTQFMPDNGDYHYFWRQKRKAKKIREMLEINFGELQSSFVTLTFKNQPDSVESCNKCFRNMVRSLKRKYDGLLFVAVLEVSEGGSLHYHAIFNVIYSAQFEQDILQAWHYGNDIDIQLIYDMEKLSWYITKQFREENKFFYGKKRFLHSKKIIPAVSISNWDSDIKLFDKMKQLIRTETASNTYVTQKEGCGKMEVIEYAINLGMFADYIVAVRTS